MTRAKKDPLRFATFTWTKLLGDKSVYFLERNSSSESVGYAIKLSPGRWQWCCWGVDKGLVKSREDCRVAIITALRESLADPRPHERPIRSVNKNGILPRHRKRRKQSTSRLKRCQSREGGVKA